MSTDQVVERWSRQFCIPTMWHEALACETEAASQFTSIYAYIQALQPTPLSAAAALVRADKLLRFRDEVPSDAPAIPYTLKGHLGFVDWSGRIARSDKRGAIDDRASPILTRLGIDPGVWQSAMALRGNVFGRALGRLDHLRLHAAALGQRRIKGLMQAQRLYRTAYLSIRFHVPRVLRSSLLPSTQLLLQILLGTECRNSADLTRP